VYTEKKALIITDSGVSLDSTAQSIKDCLQGCEVKICSSKEFAGTDLLPAQIFFLGCNSPNPGSFSYLEEILSHINLVSRKCGVFSADKKSLEYLCGILKHCEADVVEPLLITNGNDKPAIEKWLKGITG
jgi:hypothetical protein